MMRVLLHSVWLHLGWFIGSFSKRGRAVSPLGGRRLLLLLILFPAYLLAQGIHWLGFLLDEIFFRGYRRIAVRAPLFVVGIPRSGTTFVHRTLAGDTAQFSTVRTWQAVLAPSVTERKCWQAVGFVDRLFGGLGKRMVAAALRKAEGDFARIHAVGLDAPEEDYLFLLPAGACFIAVLAFPSSEGLWGLGRFESLSPSARQRILGFYRRCLQKHLFASGQNRHLLSKNAAFASWIPSLREAFPEARFVVCVREPTEALPSQLRAIAGGYAAAGGRSLETHLAPRFAELYAHAYAVVALELINHPERFAVVDQNELKEAPDRILRSALGHLGIAVTPALEEALKSAAEASQRFRQEHRQKTPFYSLSCPRTDASLARSYSAILAQRDRMREQPPAGAPNSEA